MSKKLILFYDSFSEEYVKQFKEIIQFDTEELSVVLMDYHYSEAFDILEKNGHIIPEASVCIFFLYHQNSYSEHFNQKLSQLAESIIRQHILLIPVPAQKMLR